MALGAEEAGAGKGLKGTDPERYGDPLRAVIGGGNPHGGSAAVPYLGPVLDNSAIRDFVRDGYVVVRAAAPPDVVEVCGRAIDAELRSRGVDPDDRRTWTAPVVRFVCPEGPPFAEAGSQPGLWAVYDQLLGPGAWWRRRGVGGTVPVRFPHADDPGDTGWHIDGSFDVGGEYWVNLRSRERGLLLLYLLSDVGDDDAPTELKVGSHLDVPGLLEPFGDTGTSFATVSPLLPPSTFERPSAFATGRAGDVFVCHPFLVHRATWPHRGARPRAVAQPAVAIHHPFGLDPDDACPVEEAILTGLDRARST
jgi:hypothetical protein